MERVSLPIEMCAMLFVAIRNIRDIRNHGFACQMVGKDTEETAIQTTTTTR